MNWKNKTVGFALSGSHCTVEEVLPEIQRFVDEGASVIPIVSATLKSTDTRFGNAKDWLKKLKEITGNDIISTIVEAEPLGPSKKLDVLVIAPCTGNTTSKLANAMTDSPVIMAAKAQLRNLRPVVLAISTNDGLGLNASNIAKLYNAKNIYFVPYGQDNPEQKPNSLVANMDLVVETCAAAIEGKQIQPMIISYNPL
ncbi:dipicolinate synthase subunit B [Chengkuizengella axinellae]|uniref:Dipicolinate synthase subunit B n=1 Tax=Chengkuizengella axinellae TaxID=3064388 RepID=A0ABT9IXH0_9BACL|nr:dipicolinate synthase subunit B [Chengkuizengella sp. 2205SS18-9]MDP5273495.1 dipicolinate synthase subunit B [Chengkuizengella sp. 2205SS18-9]